MSRLTYVSVQPAVPYYRWQVEVMLSNFDKTVRDADIHVVCSVSPEQGEWDILREKYPRVKFSFYEDTREKNIGYVSTIRPHLLAKHFTRFPELQHTNVFYHDCDMVFTKPVDWNHLLEDDVWYLSDTSSYIGANYVRSKGEDVYTGMCNIIGIDYDTPIMNQKRTGGAQYIMKNVSVDFWKKVERDSESLYRFFLAHLKTHPESPTYHPIQSWTADMWAVLWNAWYFNHETRISKDMYFCWPMDPIDRWDARYIYHNAGVVEYNLNDGLFYKGMYINRVPKNIPLNLYKNDVCSYNYLLELKRAFGEL